MEYWWIIVIPESLFPHFLCNFSMSSHACISFVPLTSLCVCTLPYLRVHSPLILVRVSPLCLRASVGPHLLIFQFNTRN